MAPQWQPNVEQMEEEEVATVSTVSERSKSRLGNCEVCKVTEAKYTCPACAVTSCSLQCSKKHKVDSDCDGIRIRTSFVKINEFGNLHLLSDYRLLDDISCKVDACRRDKLNKVPNPNHPRHFNNRSSKLKHAVLYRGADFVILPNEFARHRNNYSAFDARLKLIKWKLQLTFLNAAQFTIFEERCSEETILGNLLEKHLNSEGNPAIYKKLETYRKVGLSDINVLMKAERVPASEKKFFKLDVDKSLRENFVGKTIVEFPQLYVLIEGCFTSKVLPKGVAETGQLPAKNWLLSDEDTKKQGHVKGQGHASTSFQPQLRGQVNESSTEDSGEEPDEIDMSLGADKLPSYRELLQRRQT